MQKEQITSLGCFNLADLMLAPPINFPVHGGHKLPVKLLSSLLVPAGPRPEHPYPGGCSRLTPQLVRNPFSIPGLNLFMTNSQLFDLVLILSLHLIGLSPSLAGAPPNLFLGSHYIRSPALFGQAEQTTWGR